MKSSLKKFTKSIWWAIATGGAVSIIFGLIALIWPNFILSFFIYVFSFLVLAISAIILGRSLTNIGIDRLWWLSMLFSICGISFGLFIMVDQEATKLLLSVTLAIYIFSESLLDLVAASYTNDQRSRLPILVAGITGILVGFLVLIAPHETIESLIRIIGIYIIVHGAITEYYAIRVRNEFKEISRSIKKAARDLTDSIVEGETISQSSNGRTSKKASPKKK